jgi:hypothetical protein
MTDSNYKIIETQFSGDRNLHKKTETNQTKVATTLKK